MRDSMVELTGSVDEDENNRNVYAFSQISGSFSEKYQSTPTEGRVQRESSPSVETRVLPVVHIYSLSRETAVL